MVRDRDISVDMHLWLENIEAKYADLDDFEALTPEEQMRFNEELLDFLYDMVNSMMMFQLRLRNFENAYELGELASLSKEITKEKEIEKEEEVREMPRDIYL